MSGSVALTWTVPSTGSPPFTYQVHYSTDQINWTPFGSPISATSLVVTGLQDGTTYYFQVDAINSLGTSPWSNTVSEATAVPVGTPGAPTGLTATSPTSSSISLSWTAPTTGTGPFTYQPQYSVDQVNWTPFGAQVSGTSVIVTGLSTSTLYYFRVDAINSAGAGPWSTTASQATSSAAGAPSAPTGLTAFNATATSISLLWTAPTTGTGPFTYQPQYSTDQKTWSPFGTPVSSTAVTVTGLASTTTYYFRVDAIGSGSTGTSGWSAAASATTAAAGTAGAVFTTYGVRNASTSAVTAPYHQGGHTFAPGQIPSGSYPEVRPHGSSSAVSKYQWDEVSTRKDGSWYFAVLTMAADGTFQPYQSSGDTNTYDIVPKTGSPPYTTSTVTPSTIAANSQIQLRLSGVDLTAELANGSDYFYGDFNYILANYSQNVWGSNPTGGWELVQSGSVCNKYWGWMCARRHSDNAVHKWLVVAFELKAYATGEIVVNPVVLQPWMYGAHSAGTIGVAANAQPNVSVPAQPRYAGFYELWDAKSSTLIGARGGPNDPRQFTIPASNFSSSTNMVTLTAQIVAYANQAGGGMPAGTGWLFQAASGGTLPSLVDPNWVYWVGNPTGSPTQVFLGLERGYATGWYNNSNSGVANWAANSSVGQGKSLVVNNNSIYYYPVGGITGTTQPVPNPVGSAANPLRTDNTAQYVPTTAVFGTPGTGNIKAVPVSATFTNTAVDFKDENAQPYWYDPVNHKAKPWTVGMPDFTYTTKTSHVVQPFEYHTATPVSDAGVEKYFPNDIFYDFGQGTWNVMQAPGDDLIDNRLGAWGQRNALRLYLPGDRNAAQNARAMAARFFGFYNWGWDNRTGRVPLINLGHDRNGSDYTGYPAGTINSNLSWWAAPSDNTGSPTPIGVGDQIGAQSFSALVWRHNPGYSSAYGQVCNGSHCPNPSTADRVLDGDYVALQEMLALHMGVLATQSGTQRNVSAASPPYTSGPIGGLVNFNAGQPRANGWDCVKQVYIKILTPDSHLMRPYLDDNLADQSIYLSILKPFNDANYSPNFSFWGIMGPDSVQPSYTNGYWSYGHQQEGPVFGAFALGSDYPGFKTAMDNFLPGLMKIWDPAKGGCLYNVGLGLITLCNTNAASAIPLDMASLLMQACNSGDPTKGQVNYTGQTPGGSFVCPGIGQSAPYFVNQYGDPAYDWPPGPNILDGYGLWRDVGFCQGNAKKDACAVPLQVIAPVAVAARVFGADPAYAAAWQAARTRMTQGGMQGPTFVDANTYGSFQYAYTPL